MLNIIRITNENRELPAENEVWLTRAERVHRQLRPQLPPVPYLDTMRGIFQDGGEMIAAIKGNDLVGVAVFRSYRNTFQGVRVYVDDLVTDETQRSQGAGKLMIEWLSREAASRGCTALSLDSGTQRKQAHKFYFREGFTIPSFCFERPLQPAAKL